MQQTQQPTRHIAIIKPAKEYAADSEGRLKRKRAYIFTATFSERAKVAMQIFVDVCATQALAGYKSEVIGFTKAQLKALQSERAILHILKP